MENPESEIATDASCKKPPLKVFWLPEGAHQWRTEGSLVDAYYEAAKAIVDGVVSGSLREGIEGIAALFLFRHYLELRLKYVIFHGRWLKDASTNADDSEIQALGKCHSLLALWEQAKTECQTKVPREDWNSLDLSFVENFVREFHEIDPDGQGFRYPSKRIEIDRTHKETLYISVDSLRVSMHHIHSVLEMIDAYLIETHGQNEEWQDILNSF